MGREWRRHAGAVTSLPNIVTLSRLPLVILVILSLESLWRYPLFALFVLTDGIDGWLARRLEQTSAIGAILDPALDKISALLLFVVLFDRTGLAWEYAILFFARDGFLLSLSLLIPFVEIPDTSKIKARPLGKAVTNLQFVALVSMLVPHQLTTQVTFWLLGLTSALAVGDYVVIVTTEITDREWFSTRSGQLVTYTAALVLLGAVVYVFLHEEFGEFVRHLGV